MTKDQIAALFVVALIGIGVTAGVAGFLFAWAGSLLAASVSAAICGAAAVNMWVIGMRVER